ncbi:restriction endonuclease subunit S [Halomonas sp. A11-A]|uniref:restriction endonuclease subunit S n=1 Tax=Halomonas sp. A11-A TaxID=2183985 RepID=UPI000D71B555|nr:restriction endonuclease subunit S [Halomonas sp. A11-A]PWV75311.1 type I restriction enzyme S subunit [Halomonas sp. A11-A]
MSARELITDHLDLWTGAVTQKRSGGRGNNGKIELTGIKKLRELILELAVRGKLVEQDPEDISFSDLLLNLRHDYTPPKTRGRQTVSGEVTPDEQPFKKPKGWAWTRLGEIVEVLDSQRKPITKSARKDGPYPYYGASGIVDYVDGYLFDEPLVLVGEDGAKWDKGEGTAFPISGKTWVNNHAHVLRPRREAITDEYLVYFLTAADLNPYITGMTVPKLNQARLSSIPVATPSLEEQHRIVEKVDELMALCDRLEQQVGDQLEAHEVLVDTLLDALTRSADAAEVTASWARIAEHFDTLFTTEASIDKLKQAILQLAVMGRLVEQDPNDEPASVLLERIAEEKVRLVKEGKIRKQKPLPEIAHDEYPFEIPTGWAMSRMDDITNIISGIAKGKKLSGKKAVWVPYLRVANVQRGALDLSEVKEIEMACDEVEKYTVEKRDLLITEGGDWDKVGRTAIWNADIKPMTHQNHVFRARLILGEQNEHWIEKYLNSGIAREYFANSSKQTTNLASINKTQLRSCIVPVPPLDEQQRIVDKVDELMALCDQLKNRLAEAGATRTHLAEAVVEQAVN